MCLFFNAPCLFAMVQDPTVNYKHRPLLFTGHLLHISRARPALGVAPIKQMPQGRRSMDLSLMMVKSNAFQKDILRAKSNI